MAMARSVESYASCKLDCNGNSKAANIRPENGATRAFFAAIPENVLLLDIDVTRLFKIFY